MSTAGVQLDGVVARDRRGPRGRSWGALAGVTTTFEPGVHAIVGTPEDGAVAFVDAVSGALRPRKGKIHVAGRRPASDPDLRRRTGSLGYAPELPAVGTVRELAARLEQALEGVDELLPRPLASLSRREARRVELALALSTPEPLALVLFEPWSAWSPADPAELAPQMRAHADAGAVVLVISAELDRADAWADHVHLLAQGRIVGRDREVGWPLAAPVWLTVVLASPDQARSLAEGLLAVPAITSLAWDAAVVSLQAHEPHAAARAIAEAAVTRHLDVYAIQPSTPTRETLLLAAQRLHERRLTQPVTPTPAMPPPTPPASARSSPKGGCASSLLENNAAMVAKRPEPGDEQTTEPSELASASASELASASASESASASASESASASASESDSESESDLEDRP